MDRVDIFAVMEEGGEQVACGSRECLTALEAVMRELSERPADTGGAYEVSATDECMSVSAYRSGGGHEVHLYVGEADWWFTTEL